VKVLVIVPHPDDKTLCCAGTIMNFIERGDKVKVVIAQMEGMEHLQKS